MPFAVAERDGVLFLTLDTPASAINIFNHATAHQLIDILAKVTADNTRAIVFETAKPNSFINGVGLLLAHASQTYDDVARASEPPWAAYRAVRESPVPTIAVIQGSCFGCGVEFALNCDYRIASDSGRTDFYMTELNDYLFIPLFGSTWNLPAAVGLADAIDLLLWGTHWNAATAGARGLIDAVVPHEHLSEYRNRFLARVLAGEQVSGRRGRVSWGAAEEANMHVARKRIAALPPVFHPVYTDALQLLESGAKQSRSYIEHQRAELACSAASALSPVGKSAYAFFYLRQMAAQRAAQAKGRRSLVPASVVRVHLGASDSAASLFDEWHTRKLTHIEISPREAAEFSLTSRPGSDSPPAEGQVIEVSVQTELRPRPRRAAEIYAPLHRAGGRLLELALAKTGEAGQPGQLVAATEKSSRLVRMLQECGFEVALTAPSDVFITNRLLVAYFAPILRHLEGGATVPEINGVLRQAGFAQRPHHLIDQLGMAPLSTVFVDAMHVDVGPLQPLLQALRIDAYSEPDDSGGSLHPLHPLMDALCVSLLDAVLGARLGDEIHDAPTADLIARELLDFPRHLCSLCTWLKKDRVAQALQRTLSSDLLVPAAAISRAQQFVANGREFYR